MRAMFLAPIVQLSGARFFIPNGKPGIFATVKYMRQLVNKFKTDSQIRATALNIVYLMPEKYDLGEVNKLYEFVRDSIRYVKDVNNVETIATPLKTLETKQGDCDDQTVLLATLLETVGYQTRFVIAGYHDTSNFEHVYLSVLVDGCWVDCDATEQHYLGWAPPDPVCIKNEVV